MCVCACVCVCQVCVNRDERHRVRTWPCIIHEADLAEGVPGERCAIVVAADINNTASQGASFIAGVVVVEEGRRKKKKDGRGLISGEQKALFPALIEWLHFFHVKEVFVDKGGFCGSHFSIGCLM